MKEPWEKWSNTSGNKWNIRETLPVSTEVTSILCWIITSDGLFLIFPHISKVPPPKINIMKIWKMIFPFNHNDLFAVSSRYVSRVYIILGPRMVCIQPQIQKMYLNVGAFYLDLRSLGGVNVYWLVVSTHLNMSHIGNLPVKIKNIWKHHPVLP